MINFTKAITSKTTITFKNPTPTRSRFNIFKYLSIFAFAMLLGVNGVMGQTTYTLCTSTSDLVAGTKYIVVSSQTNGSALALGYQNTNYRPSVSVTISSSTVSVTPATSNSQTSSVFELTLGGSTGTWTLNDAANSTLIGATSSSNNYLKANSSATWTITFSSNAAVMTSTGGTNNILRFNTNLFSCYSSGQSSVYLYKAPLTTNYYWNGSNNTALSGTWNTSATNFTTPTATASPNAAWTDGSSNVANFLNTSGGTVTIPANRTYSQVNITNTSGNAHIFSTTNGGASGYQLGGPIALTSNSVLQLPVDNSITNDATLDLLGNVTGASGSSITLRSNVASSSNSSRLNLAATGITVSVPTINITGAGNGLAGFVSTGGFSTTLSSNIVNSSSSITTMLGVSGASTLTYSGILSGNKNLQFSAGTSGGTGTIVLSGANSYSGGNTYFNLSNGGSGIVRLGASGTFPSTTNLVFASTTGNGGSLQLFGFNQTVGSISQVDVAGSDVISNGASTASTLTITQASDQSISIPFTNGITGGTLAVVKNGANRITATGVGASYTFTGGLTIGAGEWRWNPITSNVSVAVPVTLNGGTLSTTNIAASRNVTLGTLNLAASSTLALGGDNTNTLTFAASNGVSWTGSTTLTITGWTGTAIDGTGGVNTTGPKLFIGTLATHLTATQLSQIQFSISGNNYSAVLLSTGELVPTTATRLAFTVVPSNAIPGANFSVTVQSQDANSNPAKVNSATGITITGNYVSGTAGSFTGNTGTIAVNTNSIAIGTLSYSTAAVITCTATRSSGQTLTAGTSSNITIANVTTATDYFRSNVATGNWGTAGSWQSSPDNSSWITATLVPTSASVGITIQNGHNITVDVTSTAALLTINQGGTLTVSSSQTLAIANSTGTDLVVNGTINNAGSITNAGTATVGSTGIYNHQLDGGTVPTATWDAASNCNITGNTTGGTASTINIAQTFGNFTWNCVSQLSYMNITNNSFSVAGTLTVGPSSANRFSFANTGTTFSNTVGSISVTGGILGVVGTSATVTLSVTNDVNVSGGTLNISSGASGTGILNVGRDLIVSGSAGINLQTNASNNNAQVINVTRDFTSTSTSATVVDFGNGATVTSNAINIGRHFSKSGTGTFTTAALVASLGFVFNGGGASQTLSYSGANSLYTSYQVSASSNLQLLTNLTLGTGTSPASYFTVNGTLDFQTLSIIAGNTTDPRFITAAGATLITSNTAGLGGTVGSGSLQNFGSVNTTSAAGRAMFIAGVNYTFNGATTTPFPTVLGAIGNPANIIINAAVTANSAITSTGNFTIQSGSYDVTSLNNYALNITGNFTNNGTFTPRSGTVTFNGSNALQTISGAAITTPFNNITVNKGTSNANILNVTSVITLASGGLTITNGTFKLSSASTITPFSSSGTIPSTGGLWNNGGTISAGSASVTVSGIFRASDGTINIGSNLIGASTTTYTIDGGTVNVVGRFLNSGGSYTMSSGNLTLGTTAPNVSGNATFEHTVSSNINISGGTITIQNANANTGGDLLITNTSGTKSITGGTIVFGNGSTPNSTNFKCNASGAGSAGLFNVTLGATNSPTVTLQAAATVSGTLTLTSGAILADGGFTLSLAGNLAGTGTHTGAGKITMTASGATISGATLQNLELNNAGGFSLSGSPTINGALTLTNGKLTIGANTLSLAGTVASMSASNSLVGSASSILSVSGAGALGSLFFDQTTDGTSNKLSSFTINRTTSGTLTIGNKLVVTGLTTITAGTVNVTYVTGIASTAFTPTTQSVTFSSTTPTNGTYQLFNGQLSVTTQSFSSTNTPTKDVTFNYTSGAVSVGNGTVVTISNTQFTNARNITRGTTELPIYRFQVDVTNTAATLSSLGFTTPATIVGGASDYVNTDITNFKAFLTTSTTFSNSTQLGSTSPSGKTQQNAGETLIDFTSLATTLNVGTTYYIWLTADILNGAVAGRKIVVNAPTVGITGSVTGTNSATGVQTIEAVATNYYLNTGGSVTTSANYFTSPNGVGTTLSAAGLSNTSNDIILNIPIVVTNTGDFTLGNGSKIVVQNGGSLTVGVANTIIGTIDVNDGGTLTFNNTSIPTTVGILGTTSSTVIYSASGAQAIQDKTYVNLSIGGSGVKTLGTTTVTGTLTQSGTATLGTASPTLTGATLAYVDNTNSQAYTAGLEWPNTDGPSNVTVNLSGTGSPSLTLSGSRVVAGTLALTSGNLAIGAYTLTLNGAISGSGTLTGGSSCNLTIGGAAGTISFTSGARTLNNLIIGTGNAASMTLGSALDIAPTGGITFNAAGTKSFTTTGQTLTLKSDATGTAYIGNINSTTLTGNVTVERYIASAGRRWRFLSSPIQSKTIVDWRNQFAITGPGTTTSSTIGGFNSSGWHQTYNNITNSTAAPYTSVRLYVEANSTSVNLNLGWADVTTGTTLTAGQGFRAFIRGPIAGITDQLGVNGNAQSQAAVTLSLSGTINSGDITPPAASLTFSGAGRGWNLLGNPYPCAYNFKSMYDANIGTEIANINPNVYAYNSIAGTPGYVSYNALSNTSGGLTGGIIPSGAGFFIEASNTPTFVFKETYKTTTAPVSLHKTDVSKVEFGIKYSKDTLQGDYMVVKMFDGATLNSELYDIKKLKNDDLNLSAYGTDNVDLTGSCIPFISEETRIKLNVEAAEVGTYKFNFTNMDNFDAGVSVSLYDRYTNTTTDVKKNTKYTFELGAGTNQWGKNRFELILNGKATTGVNENTTNLTAAQLSVYPNPATDVLNISLSNGTSIETVNIYNVTGKLVNNTKLNGNQIDISQLNNGVYMVEVLTANGSFKTKFVK